MSLPVTLRNLLLVFLLSGLWHGAAWTFVIWGGLHGVYMVIGEVTSKWRANLLGTRLGLDGSRIYHFLQLVFTLNLVMIGWVFFRARSLQSAWYIIGHMYVPSRVTFIDMSYGVRLDQFQTLLVWVLIALLVVIDSFIYYRPARVMQLWQSRPLRWRHIPREPTRFVFFGVWGQIQFIYFSSRQLPLGDRPSRGVEGGGLSWSKDA